MANRNWRPRPVRLTSVLGSGPKVCFNVASEFSPVTPSISSAKSPERSPVTKPILASGVFLHHLWTAPRLARVTYSMLTLRVGCCHLSGLLCSLQAAGPDEDPRISAPSKSRARKLIGAGGFGRSRSNLWCHHAVSRPRKPKESLMCRPRRLYGCRARGAVSSCSFF